MPPFHFHIVEDERVVKDEEGQEFSENEAVRREAVETGASIARDAFIQGSASRVIVDVRSGDQQFLKVTISLTVEGGHEFQALARLHEPIATNCPAGWAPKTGRRALSSWQPCLFSAINCCLLNRCGILATDMSDRATWLRS